jgi:hypothetical protein
MSIHQTGVLFPKRVASVGTWLILSGMLLLPGFGIAQTVTLTDVGSSAAIDLVGGAGMNNWSVLGQNQLMQQWFWYRTDDNVAHPINSIGGLTYHTYTGLNGTANELDATYQNSQLSIEIDYVLSGGGVGTGNADMTETITARNLSGSQLNLNFYEYSYFDLLQSGNNNITIFGDSNSGYDHVLQTSGSTAIQEGIISPNANYAEAANYSQTLDELNNQPGLLLNGNTSAGAGDVTWAFQWDQNIAPGGELDIFKDKNLSISMVPEPSTMAIITLGAGALCLTLRRKLS